MLWFGRGHMPAIVTLTEWRCWYGPLAFAQPPQKGGLLRPCSAAYRVP